MTNNLKQTLFVGCCAHGNEQIGLALAQKYPMGKSQNWSYQSVICNPKAVEINQRFVEQDLNRSFPGIEGGNYEQNRAFEIVKLLQKADFIIDIHQTTAQNNDCLIVNRLSKLNNGVLQYINIKNVIIDNFENNKFEFNTQTNEAGGLCLDSVFPTKSLTIEYSQNGKPNQEFEVLEKDFINLINQNVIYNDKEYYTFVGSMARQHFDNDQTLINFVELTLTQKIKYKLDISLQIYPCFIGEKSYQELYCFWLKKVKIKI